MPAAEPADPGRAKAIALERLEDESPALTNLTKRLDDLPVHAHKACHQVEQGATSFRFISVAAVCAISAFGDQAPHSPPATHSVCPRPQRPSMQPRCISLALDLTPL